MQSEYGEIVIYQAEDGKTSLEVRLQDETVWLSQSQLVHLFAKTKQNISLHLRNIFREGELAEKSVVKESLTTAADGKKYKTRYYNLDVIISVGYRIKSIRGTQFRIWATSVLRDHLIKGHTVNEKRLAEKGLSEMEQTIALLAKTLARHEALSDEGKAVLEVVGRYAKSWSLLLKYDEDRLELPKGRHPLQKSLDYAKTGKAIKALKDDLLARGEASVLFGQEREKWPQEFEQADKWRICYLLIARWGLTMGAEDGKENETDTLSGIQSQSGVGSYGWRQDAGRTGAAV